MLGNRFRFSRRSQRSRRLVWVGPYQGRVEPDPTLVVPILGRTNSRKTNLSRKRQHIKTPLVSIVDDDWSLVEATVSLLQSLGYLVKGFRSAEDFLESRQLLETDCLILDIRMPSMGGFELQRRLAARNYQIPIIFVTSYDSEDAQIQAARAGAVGFLYKPFSQESLFRAVRSALGSRRKDRS
jgi:FixJ family two-component response regulator